MGKINTDQFIIRNNVTAISSSVLRARMWEPGLEHGWAQVRE